MNDEDAKNIRIFLFCIVMILASIAIILMIN